MAIGGKALLGIAALATGGLFLVGKKAKAAPKPGEPGGAPASSQPGAELEQIPAGVLAKITAALKSNSAKVLRQTADEIEKAGFGAQAADLRARAAQLEKAAKKAKKTEEPPPLSQERISGIIQTIETGNIEAIKMLANGLRREGYEKEADDLDAAAKKLEQAAKEAKQSATTAAEPEPKITVKTPGIAKTTTTPKSQLEQAAEKVLEQATAILPKPAAAATGPTSSERTLAGQVALSLRNAKKGSEDKALVRRFQAQEGIVNSQGVNDGLYGTSTGLVLADKYDIVPPKPLYWGTKAGGYASLLSDKSSWRSAMMAHAKADPQRAEEWARAAAV
jgi:hypothetical protein